MRIAGFILSDKPSHRIARHLVLWTVYCTYFWVQSLAPRRFAEFRDSDTYYFAFLNLCCFAPVFIFAAYFSTYYLLPRTLERKRYLLFLIALLLVYAGGTVVNYFMAGVFLRHVHYSTPVEVNFEHQMEFGNYNTRWGMIVATAVVGIKLAKNWYLQAQENLEMLKKKNRTEMQLQKACLRPVLLFRSLDTIYERIRDGSGEELAMILRLSELLSYSLYEKDKELVPLERELEQLRNFVAIEQADNGVDLQIRTSVDTAGKYIAPLTTIRSLEEAIASSDCGEQEARWTEVLVVEANGARSIALVFQNESGATVELPLALNPKAVVYENE